MKEIEEGEREESRVEAEIVRLPALSTPEDTDYEKQWEAKRAQTYAVHREHTVCRWLDTFLQQCKNDTEHTVEKVGTITNDTGFLKFCF